MLSEEKAADLRVKELELLNNIISRMATYSSASKNYCLTITTAICGLAISNKSPYIIFLSVVPVILFFYLDGKYLRSERAFRSIYEIRIHENWAIKPSFDMRFSSEDSTSLRKALLSWSILPFYSMLSGGILLVFLAMKLTH